MRNEILKGMKWGEIAEGLKEELLNNANCINGKTCENVENGECIIDLNDELSIVGEVKDGEIIIDANSTIYSPIE